MKKPKKHIFKLELTEHGDLIESHSEIDGNGLVFVTGFVNLMQEDPKIKEMLTFALKLSGMSEEEREHHHTPIKIVKERIKN